MVDRQEALERVELYSRIEAIEKRLDKIDPPSTALFCPFCGARDSFSPVLGELGRIRCHSCGWCGRIDTIEQ